jgi:hypothetical protein
MAKKKSSESSGRGSYHEKPKKRRPGIHSKKRHSKIKVSRHYRKLSRGQGK